MHVTPKGPLACTVPAIKSVLRVLCEHSLWDHSPQITYSKMKTAEVGADCTRGWALTPSFSFPGVLLRGFFVACRYRAKYLKGL